jgi:hypothetical protein
MKRLGSSVAILLFAAVIPVRAQEGVTAEPIYCKSTGQTIPAGTPGSQLDSLCPPEAKAGSSAPANSLQQAEMNAAGQIGFALGQAIGQALFGNKTTNAAAAAAAAEAEREREEEAEKEAALAKQKQQEMYDRLSRSLKLSGLATLSLKGFDNDYNSGLQLKGFGNASSSPGGDLQLKGFGNSQPSNNPPSADGSQVATTPFGLGGNPCLPSSVDSNTVDLRADTPGVCPGAPTGDPKVVDLRDVQQGVDLAVVAANATPADRDVILDQALDAANGNQSIQVNLASSSSAPTVNENGLRAFQQANAAYRQARESAYQHQVAYNEAEKKREMAQAIVGTYQSQLEADFQNHIDEMTLAQKQETMAKIFDAAVQERIAYGKTWAEYLAASAQYKFDKLAAEDELMRLAQTGKYDPNAPPPVPTKADLDLLSPIADLPKGPTKEDAALLQEIELSNGGLLNVLMNSKIENRELEQFPPAIVQQYNSNPAFQKQMQDEHGQLFGARDAATQAATHDLEKEWDQKLAGLRDQGLLQPGVSLTAQEQANPQLHAQLQAIRQQLISEADYKTARAQWQANDKWQAWIEAQNARLTGKPASIYMPGP